MCLLVALVPQANTATSTHEMMPARCERRLQHTQIALKRSRAARHTLSMEENRITLPALAPAPARLSESRMRLLRELLGSRATGLTADELADAVAVSRNAVQQQLTALEREGLVTVLELRSTGGRPSRAYALTDAGLELFPRHYARMAEALLRHTQELFGEEGLQKVLVQMADELTATVAPRLEGKEGDQRVREVVSILDDLGYGAYLDENGNVHAVNCVFHQLAQSSDAVCQYDAMILRKLLGSDFDHLSCMRDGRPACVFAPH